MKIFLGGGGDAAQSYDLDALFFKTIKDLSLSYIPLAMEASRFPGCEEWFSGVCGHHGRTQFKMVTDVATTLDPSDAFYIGGGDTVHLAHALEGSPMLSTILRSAVVYGGSAGAILLGKTLRTCPEGFNLGESRGLNLVKGHSVACHFGSERFAMAESVLLELSREVGPILVLSEDSGMTIDCHHETVTAVGKGRSYRIDSEAITELKPGDTLQL